MFFLYADDVKPFDVPIIKRNPVRLGSVAGSSGNLICRFNYRINNIQWRVVVYCTVLVLYIRLGNFVGKALILLDKD